MIYLIIFLLILFTFIYLRIYLRPVSTIRVSSDGMSVVVPVKPNRKFFRSVSSGSSSGLVHLGSGYYAFYCYSEDLSGSLDYRNISVVSDIYILYRKRFKFRSVDLSDRCLIDILNKFNKNKEVK